MENVPATIEPENDMASGAKAADALLALVKKAGLSKSFGGPKEHLFYEGWQALAKFYHCSVKTLDAQPVTIGETSGAKARAEIIDDATGLVMGGAEAYCMRDEKNWKEKPWFQLASMAQTRAGSKACRNKWAFVPALVGFATTPAEEMDEVKNGHSEQKTKPQDAFKGQENQESISEPMRRNFWRIAKSTKATDDQIKEWLYREYDIEHTKNIPRVLYDEICERIKIDLEEKGE